jgi:hypothetical protein
MSTFREQKARREPDNAADWLEVVHTQVSSLRFGVVQITIHESRVVQIDTTERIRVAGVSRATKPEQAAAGLNQLTKQDRPAQPEGS